MFTRVTSCRICGNPELVPVLDLGVQALTGVFPRTRETPVTAGPLRLVKCVGAGRCGLLQLEHSYPLTEMYGENYGYRSGINPTMVEHLHGKVRRIVAMADLAPGDLVLDIGSNDGTTLAAYPHDLTLVGMDPTGVKFGGYYPKHVELIPDFFSARRLAERHPGRRAKVVTSFAMFYDLEQPLDFMREVREVLADDGVWVFEQSYMPAMLAVNAYDTVCHEHLEYYALAQIQWMTDRAGLRIVDVEINDVNGGSFSVTVTPGDGDLTPGPSARAALDDEAALRLDALATYRDFARRVEDSRAAIRTFLDEARAAGRTVAGLGASTKGNVILQYCGLSAADIPYIGEVNGDKYGAFTPGTMIPIVSEDELLARRPDHILVLPWHFWRYFESSPRFAGRDLVVPLPELRRLAT
jgi:hypothetical protein